MKTAFLPLALCSCLCFGQQAKPELMSWANWMYQDHELYWSTVYRTDSIGVDALTKRTQLYLRSRSYVINIEVEPGLVTADIVGMMIDYKKYKLPETFVDRYIRDGKWYGRVLYELKDNRYRVTFSGVAVDMGTIGIAAATKNIGVGVSQANLQAATEIFISSNESEILKKNEIFVFNQFLFYELELKRSIVARGDF